MIEFNMPSIPTFRGWQCPLCQMVYAPTVQMCAKHAPVQAQTSSGGCLSGAQARNDVAATLAQQSNWSANNT